MVRPLEHLLEVASYAKQVEADKQATAVKLAIHEEIYAYSCKAMEDLHAEDEEGADRFSFAAPNIVRVRVAIDEERYEVSFKQEWMLAATETSDPDSEKSMDDEALEHVEQANAAGAVSDEERHDVALEHFWLRNYAKQVDDNVQVVRAEVDDGELPRWAL